MFPARFLVMLVNLIFGFIELLLTLRILLRFFGANAETPFVKWIYDTSEPLIAPFRGMFPSPVLGEGFIIEINTLIALLFYALIGYLVGELIAMLQYHSSYSYRKRIVAD